MSVDTPRGFQRDQGAELSEVLEILGATLTASRSPTMLRRQ
jgi:hypothetical protein